MSEQQKTAGYKVVPVEPTAEMREAGHRAAWQSVPSLFDRDDVANVYRAMLAAAPAARLEDQPPPADVAMLASANRELSTRMAKVIAALHKAPVPFAEAIDNDKYLVSNVETIVAELIGEQVRASELQELVIGLLRAELTAMREDLNDARSEFRKVAAGLNDAAQRIARQSQTISRLQDIEAAARNLAKVKGRHNSEIAMNQLLEALK